MDRANGIDVYTSVVHPRIAQWVYNGKLHFQGKVSAYTSDDLDPILFKLWGIVYLSNEYSDEWTKWCDMDLAWLTSEHALTLFKAKCIVAGVTDFDPK